MVELPLTLLHLSDIHFQKPTLGSAYDLDSDLRDKLEVDAKAMATKLGPPRAILVTGDIAFGGQESEYVDAYNWLDNGLSAAVGGDPASVRCVPGNHDVVRGLIRAKPTYSDVRKKLRECEVARIDELLHFHLAEPEVFYEGLAPYNDFARKLNCDVDVKRPVWDMQDQLTLNDGSSLRVYGLNSVLISDEHDHYELRRLVLGSYQSQIKEEPGVRNLVMCHHPPDWLRDGERVDEILAPRCSIQLFGHKHKHRLKQMTPSLLRVSAGAVHPERDDSDWEPRYNWLQVWVDSGDGNGNNAILKVRAFPRVWSKEEQRFSADRNNADAGVDYKDFDLTVDRFVPAGTATRLLPIGENAGLPGSGDRCVIEAANSTSETSDSRGNPILDPERALVRRYFALGYVQRMRIANALDLFDDGDVHLTEGMRQKLHLVRAKAKGRATLAKLWSTVEQAYGDGRYPTNPFE